MKIVNRKTFLEMPENTLFSTCEPTWFGPLSIKGGSLDNDYFEQQIADAVKCGGSQEFASLCLRSARTGESMEMDFDCMGRDGCFDDGGMYAVWENDDVRALIKRLEECVNN